jgi:uncharacterized protein YvpB
MFISSFIYLKNLNKSKNEVILDKKINEKMASTLVIEKEKVKVKQPLDVPLILQMPELMRGCEVTSLAMILNYRGIKVSKMELAEKITFQPFLNGSYHGNMHKGFVGDIKTFNNPGLGVYVEPIINLAKNYVPESEIINLTGNNPEDLYQMIDSGFPVWIITNATFKELSDNQFQTWETDDGEMKVTYHEHSVVITGYDDNYVYINDPLKGSNIPKNRVDFEKAWIQMGRQAMTVD